MSSDKLDFHMANWPLIQDVEIAKKYLELRERENLICWAELTRTKISVGANGDQSTAK